MIQLPRLRGVRQRRLISQKKLAADSGVSESTINRLEQGLQLARYVTVRKLAESLGVDPAELMAPDEAGKAAA